jgi:hypothetical protein
MVEAKTTKEIVKDYEQYKIEAESCTHNDADFKVFQKVVWFRADKMREKLTNFVNEYGDFDIVHRIKKDLEDGFFGTTKPLGFESQKAKLFVKTPSESLVTSQEKALNKLSNKEIAELLVKNGVYVIPKDKGECRRKRK